MDNTAPWYQWYYTARWQKRRRAQRLREPLCAMCLKHGIVTPATIADHIEPHRGDWNKFITGPLQSLCEHCHNALKRREELHGFTCDVGDDGWPIDPRHPANR